MFYPLHLKQVSVLCIFLVCCAMPMVVMGFDPLPNGDGCCTGDPMCIPCNSSSLGGVVLEWLAGGDNRTVVEYK